MGLFSRSRPGASQLELAASDPALNNEEEPLSEEARSTQGNSNVPKRLRRSCPTCGKDYPIFYSVCPDDRSALLGFESGGGEDNGAAPLNEAVSSNSDSIEQREPSDALAALPIDSGATRVDPPLPSLMPNELDEEQDEEAFLASIEDAEPSAIGPTFPEPNAEVETIKSTISEVSDSGSPSPSDDEDAWFDQPISEREEPTRKAKPGAYTHGFYGPLYNISAAAETENGPISSLGRSLASALLRRKSVERIDSTDLAEDTADLFGGWFRIALALRRFRGVAAPKLKSTMTNGLEVIRQIHGALRRILAQLGEWIASPPQQSLWALAMLGFVAALWIAATGNRRPEPRIEWETARAIGPATSIRQHGARNVMTNESERVAGTWSAPDTALEPSDANSQLEQPMKAGVVATEWMADRGPLAAYLAPTESEIEQEEVMLRTRPENPVPPRPETTIDRRDEPHGSEPLETSQHSQEQSMEPEPSPVASSLPAASPELLAAPSLAVDNDADHDDEDESLGKPSEPQPVSTVQDEAAAAPPTTPPSESKTAPDADPAESAKRPRRTRRQRGPANRRKVEEREATIDPFAE